MKNKEMKIDITEQELKDLKEVRNYFIEHDKTLFEHKAYEVLDRVVKKLILQRVSSSFLEKFQEIIYGDLSDSEALNALHKLDNDR